MQAADPVPVGDPLSIKGLTALLVQHYGIHEGFYDLFIEYRMAFGAFGPTAEEALPGSIIGISQISITRAEKVGPLTVDAAEVNPNRTVKAKKAVKKSAAKKAVTSRA